MAGDYEKAFEKWLGKSKDENQLPALQGKESESASNNNFTSTVSAPILVDDDEDHESEEYFKNLGAGPPVLEPVSHHARNVFDAVDRDALNFTSKQNQTGVSQGKFQTLEKPFKTYSAYGNTQRSPPKKKKQEIENDLETKISSKNIFDKFSPASGLYINDSPPPLIPSPKALAEEQQMSPEGDAKNPAGKSPDFCAMEADSTSEIQTCDKGLVHSDKNHSDVLLECDSTCMLGGSPAIVSPISNSTFGDAEEIRDISDSTKQHRNVEIQCCEDNFGEKDSAGTKSNSKDICALEVNGKNNCSHNDFHKTPMSKKADKSIGVNLIDNKTNFGFSVVDPPSLAALCSPIKQQNRRKQRHTVDSAEGLAKNKKIYYSNDIRCGPPPLLSPQECDDELLSTSSRLKDKKSMKCKKAARSKRPCFKRSITVPVASNLNNESIFVNALWQLSQLQTQMHTLLSNLWPQLQLGDMTPESPQFNTVIADLVKALERPDNIPDNKEKNENPPMPCVKLHDVSENSKEDLDYRTVLKSKQISTQESPSTFQVDHCKSHQAVETSQQSADKSAHYSSKSFPHGFTNHSHVHSEVSEIPPLLDLARNTLETVSHAETSFKQQHQTSVTLEPSNNSTNFQNHLPSLSFNTSVKFIPFSLECPLSGLSKLSLADRRELCPRPVSVMMPQDPESSLADFSSLSCRALQLLLPEVPVSLTNELSCSPKALIAFIDNILAINNRTKKISQKKVIGSST